MHDFHPLAPLEEAIEKTVTEFGKNLPIEFLLESIQGLKFKADGDNFFYTTFMVCGKAYYLSVRRRLDADPFDSHDDDTYLLSIWKNSPRDQGYLIRDYSNDEKIKLLFNSLSEH